jgi:cysteinyl-tRNA synthetase
MMVMLKIYNTLSRKRELFKPRNGNRVNLFVCGPTVYDDSHIGHARTYIVFDLIVRYLKYRGYSIFYLQNITDIDDKIMKRASELGLEPLKLAQNYEIKYYEDMKSLDVESVNYYARATEHIPEIITQIRTLIGKGYAYETDSGVYFNEKRFDDFGRLSGRSIEDLTVHRITPDPTKKNPGDFALWKKTEDKPCWDSPWGSGRPGWHIEDTAITETYFGPQYDIHGGGLDLIFPHHEAEIAQMESASGMRPMVNYWMHTGFLKVEGEKMSKSIGNFITIRELLKENDPEVFRFFVLSTHYRSPINFSNNSLKQSENSLKRINKLIETVDKLLDRKLPVTNDKDGFYEKKLSKAKDEFFIAMDNDFNTPDALSAIFNLIRDINRYLTDGYVTRIVLNNIKDVFREFGSILGLSFLREKKEKNLSDDLLELLVNLREELRDKKDWELSDKIRSKLRELDIYLEDK